MQIEMHRLHAHCFGRAMVCAQQATGWKIHELLFVYMADWIVVLSHLRPLYRTSY